MYGIYTIHYNKNILFFKWAQNQSPYMIFMGQISPLPSYIILFPLKVGSQL